MTMISATYASASNAVEARVPGHLHHAAVQFEALMLKELLQPLTKAGQQEEDDEGSTGPLQGFAAEAVAGSLANSGALGFARQIEQSLGAKTFHKNLLGGTQVL